MSSSEASQETTFIDTVTDQASAAVNNVQSGFSNIYSRFQESDTLTNIFSGDMGSRLFGPKEGGKEATRVIMPLMTMDNPIFKSFATCAGILGTKLLFNSTWTAYNRIQRKVFSSPEDVAAFGGVTVNQDDEVVERIRRMHLNDLENYTPFFILGLLYVATEPNPTEANIVFRTFVTSRLAHTALYLGCEHQPGRLIAFLGGWTCNAFMAYRIMRAIFS